MFLTAECDHRVYKNCLQYAKLPSDRIKQLSKTEFWRLKRARVSEYKIGLISGLDSERAVQFSRRRGKIVHSLLCVEKKN